MKNKENALHDFLNAVLQSWTYDRLTETEKESLLHALKKTPIFGTYTQRIETLHSVKYAFLCALGYNNNPITWREEKPENIPFSQP